MMLCLVRQPNAVIIEVQVEQKAKGKQCLDKVCEMLGIIESDYMGLQYSGPHGEKLWLNLRNQIRRQHPGPQPYRLHLRVKFFVPPHLLLQNVTRHHFFLDVQQAFVEGRLRVTSRPQLHRLAALAAQAERGDLEGRAAALLAYPRLLPPAAACRSPSASPRTIRVRWRSGSDDDVRIAPAQPPTGDGDSPATDDEEPPTHLQTAITIETDRTELTRACQGVLEEHAKLRGMKASTAEYLFLKEASSLEDFGMEQYFAKTNTGETLRVGVGPTGILIHDLNLQLKHSITYAAVHLATHAGRCFFLTFLSTNGESRALGLKLENCHSASALYRAVTEKHAFYSCETVRNAVTSQFIRDLKGTIASLFNENTATGKNYVFDIQRTCREVYDHTRRSMYQVEAGKGELGSDEMNNVLNQDCRSTRCKIIQEQLAAFQDSMLCRVCMDSDVSTVFFPCRHVACCSTCAPLCKSCPLCRGEVAEAEYVYLPYSGSSAPHNTDDNT